MWARAFLHHKYHASCAILYTFIDGKEMRKSVTEKNEEDVEEDKMQNPYEDQTQCAIHCKNESANEVFKLISRKFENLMYRFFIL